jgi:5'(3')-deoxyribonucleotidase
MKTVFIDLDGVLTDFCGAVAKYYPRETAKVQWPPNKWNFIPQLGLDVKEFWENIPEEFWSEMDILPDGYNLLCDIRKSGIEYCIITSPSENKTSFSGKCLLLKNLFQDEYKSKRWIMAHDKRYFAAGNILIDDYDGNIEKWRLYGGDGFLFPAPYNRDRDISVYSAIKNIKDTLNI